jgi:hypothetical protein
VSLTLIGEYFLVLSDLRHALAFYEAAVDARLQVAVMSPNDARANLYLRNVQTRAAEIRQQFLAAYPQEAVSGGWWHSVVSEAENGSAERGKAMSADPNTCWDSLVASVGQIASGSN